MGFQSLWDLADSISSITDSLVDWESSESTRKKMGSWTPVRLVLQVCSILLLLGGIVATVYALITTDWQTLTISEFEVVHQHGLWKDCWQSTKLNRDQNGNIVENAWKCTYKFNQKHEHADHDHGHIASTIGDGQEIQHLNLKWHKVVFGLLVSSAVIGFVALLFSFCAFCAKPTAIVWSTLTFIAACCNAAGLIIFFRCSHDKDYRYVHFHGKIYEQEVGRSFFWGLGGCLALLVATVAAVLSSVLVFFAARRERLPHKTWPKHQTAV